MDIVVLLAFALTLAAGVLLSDLASRTVLSVSVVFLAAGFALGPGGAAIIQVRPGDAVLQAFVEWALVSVLFTDGMRVTTDALRKDWRLPGRALLVGMPVTIAITAGLTRLVTGLSWQASWLVGAALAPTDPVFATALVGNHAVPRRVRHLLNVESGINDGLALPIVATVLAVSGTRGDALGPALLGAGGGVLLGGAVAWLFGRLEASHVFGASQDYVPIAAVAIGLLVYALAKTLDLNEFLAAFTAGIALSASASRISERFRPTGMVAAETLKLAAVLLFGAILSSQFAVLPSLREWGVATAAVFVARPLALAPSLLMTMLGWRERLTVAWFGPKGFASIFFGILILGSGFSGADAVFRLIALTVAMSIVAHSSTDVPIAKWLDRTR